MGIDAQIAYITNGYGKVQHLEEIDVDMGDKQMTLIDKEKLEREMYHNAFEIDTDLQKWDSGCWIRYKMFENVIEEQPEVKAIPLDKPFCKMVYGDYVVYNKKWLVNNLQTEWNILQGKEYKPAIPIEWIEEWGWKNGMSESMSLRVMIDDWEKENEKSNTSK